MRAATSRPSLRRAAITLAFVCGTLALLYVVDLALASGDVQRGVRVGGLDLAGESRSEAARLLRDHLAKPAVAPITANAAGTQLRVDPARAGLVPDIEATLDRATAPALNPFARLASFFGSSEVDIAVDTDVAKLRAELDRLAKSVDKGPREGAVRFTGTTPVAVLPQPGRTVDRAAAGMALQAAYLRGTDVVELPVVDTPVKSSAADVERMLVEVARPAVSAPVLLTGGGRTFPMMPAAIASTLRIEADASGAIVASFLPARLDKTLTSLLNPIETPARDATFAVTGDKISIIPGGGGREVDMVRLSADLLPAVSATTGRTVPLVLRDTDPELTTAKAKALGIKEKIGEGTTYHPCCRARVQNIHLMADIVDGAVLLPGETFSLNGYVGPRDRRRGFIRAPMILDGEFVDAVGGGVSQFATTMFNAVFFSGMKDIEHKPHSYYISRYPPGREATVSHPAPDLKWQNDSPHGVLVKTSYTGRSITVTFYGTKRFSSVESITGPRTRYRGIYTEYRSGAGCEGRGGAPGFDVVVWRVFKQGGKEVRRERFFTRYRVESRIVCRRAPAPAPSGSPSPSPNPSPQPSPTPSG